MLDVAVLVLPDRHVVERQVRECGEASVAPRSASPALGFQLRPDRSFDLGDLGHQLARPWPRPSPLGLADLLRGGVAARLRVLELQDRGAALFVEAQEAHGELRRALEVVEPAALRAPGRMQAALSRIHRMSCMGPNPGFAITVQHFGLASARPGSLDVRARLCPRFLVPPRGRWSAGRRQETCEDPIRRRRGLRTPQSGPKVGGKAHPGRGCEDPRPATATPTPRPAREGLAPPRHSIRPAAALQ